MKHTELIAGSLTNQAHTRHPRILSGVKGSGRRVAAGNDGMRQTPLTDCLILCPARGLVLLLEIIEGRHQNSAGFDSSNSQACSARSKSADARSYACCTAEGFHPRRLYIRRAAPALPRRSMAARTSAGKSRRTSSGKSSRPIWLRIRPRLVVGALCYWESLSQSDHDGTVAVGGGSPLPREKESPSGGTHLWEPPQ